MKHTTALATIGLLCVSALGIVGCSSDAGSSDLGAEWGACMRAAGFGVEDPDDARVESGVLTPPADAEQEEFQRAGARCAKEIGVRATSTAPGTKERR